MNDEIKRQEVLDLSGSGFSKAMNEYQGSCNSYWNSLNPEEQLMAFCAIVERLIRGELEHKRSYRGMLYAGFLDLHNSIYTFEDLKMVFKNTLKELDIQLDDAQISEALAKHFY